MLRSPRALTKIPEIAEATPSSRTQPVQSTPSRASPARMRSLIGPPPAGPPAEGRGELRPAAQRRDCDRRIGGAAAADGEELARLRLAVGRRKLVDAKHLVEHRDAGAQDARTRSINWSGSAPGRVFARGAATRSQAPLPRPRRG